MLNMPNVIWHSAQINSHHFSPDQPPLSLCPHANCDPKQCEALKLFIRTPDENVTFLAIVVVIRIVVVVGVG